MCHSTAHGSVCATFWEPGGTPFEGSGDRQAFDFMCSSAFALAAIAAGQLAGEGPWDPLSLGISIVFGVAGGQVCSMLDAQLFNQPMNLVKTECGDVSGSVCGAVFNSKPIIQVFGALFCAAFSQILCGMINSATGATATPSEHSG